MAATPLSDDGDSITYQLDDGSTVKVAKDAAMRIGAPLPKPLAAPAPQRVSAIEYPTGPAAPPPPPPPVQHFGGGPASGEIAATPAPLGPGPAPVDDSLAGGPGAPPPMTPPAPSSPAIPGDAAAGGVQGAASRGMAPEPVAPSGPPGRFGAVVGEHDQGAVMQEQALRDRATAEQAADLNIANTLDQRNTQLDAIRAKQEKDQAASLTEINRRSTAVDAAMADYAKTKIDPNRLSKGMSTGQKAGLIFFQVLAGLGQVLKHKGGENPAVDMWLHQIDQDIRLQMDARDQKRDLIGQAKDSLAMFKDLAQTRQGQYSLAMAAETDRAAKTLEAVAAKTKSDTVKANALDAMGQLKQQSAAFKGEWAKTEFQADLQSKQFAEEMRSHKASEGVAYGHLAIAKQEFKEGVRRYDLDSAQRERFHQDEMLEKAASMRAKGDEKSAKLAEQQGKEGVYDPTTGKPMLQPEGEKMMRDADTLEAAARKEKDPKRAADYTARAQALRENAELQHGFRTPQAEKVKESIGHAQDLVDKVADIKRVLGTDPSSVDRETWAKLGSDFEQAKAAWIESVGAKVSSREMDAISDMFGHSPEDLTTRAFGRGKLNATLDAISDGTVKSTQANMHAQGYRGTWKAQPPRTDEVEGIKGQTSVEAGEAAKPSPVARAERAVLNPLGYSHGGTFDPETRAEEGAPVTPTGLSPQDTTTVQRMAKQYANANDDTREKIKTTIAAAATSNRPSLAAGVIGLVKGESPELYADIVKTLTPEQKANLSILDVPSRPVPQLGQIGAKK